LLLLSLCLPLSPLTLYVYTYIWLLRHRARN
jgi:hypothetical protein